MSKLIVKLERIFGHNHTFEGYAGNSPYLYYKTNVPYVDGIQRGHVRLYGKCDICGKEVHIANIHTDDTGKLYETKLDKELKLK